MTIAEHSSATHALGTDSSCPVCLAHRLADVIRAIYANPKAAGMQLARGREVGASLDTVIGEWNGSTWVAIAFLTIDGRWVMGHDIKVNGKAPMREWRPVSRETDEANWEPLKTVVGHDEAKGEDCGCDAHKFMWMFSHQFRGSVLHAYKDRRTGKELLLTEDGRCFTGSTLTSPPVSLQERPVAKVLAEIRAARARLAEGEDDIEMERRTR